MYLRNTHTGDLVEIIDLDALFDPCAERVRGRYHAGEEMQEPAEFGKSELVFPSGEALPACWTNPGYRQAQA
ncbi:acetyltransferase [Thiohalobacter sp.]|uniref:acetyltransferase n=1 Tax=Thiohalobacter sp. TaxID=2025948 RepID=UPI002629BB62|nr:acetyltransferase [Thiohalobacter sp.]